MSKLLVPLLLIALFAFTRVASQASKFKLPVVLPPYGVDGGLKSSDKNDKWGSCLFYLENLGITVFQKDKSPSAVTGFVSAVPEKDQKTSKHEFNWATDFVNCPKYSNETQKTNEKPPVQNFTIKVHIDAADAPISLKDKGAQFKLSGKYYFTLKFETVGHRGFKLTDVIADESFTIGRGEWLGSDITIPKGSAVNTSIAQIDVGAFNGYNYACSNTKIALFELDKDAKIRVGVSFSNFQFQPYNYATNDKGGVHFTRNTYDCVGTFTHASFMGIIVALVLATGLLFGFLMLNSVQTVDRFDDPKQKQLIINAKD